MKSKLNDEMLSETEMKGIKLSTINKCLELFGFVLVIAIDEARPRKLPTHLWIERLSTFLGRSRPVGSS